VPHILTSPRTLNKLREKALQILALAIILLVIIITPTPTQQISTGDNLLTRTTLTTLIEAIIKFTRDVTATISSWGYTGIFLLMFLESSSLPIPSEIILPFSGYLVSQGRLNIWVTILVSTIAGIAGSLVDYYIGMKGMALLERRKLIRNILFSNHRMEVVENWFNKYGSIAVLFSRLIPAFRTVVSFPAGMVRMPLLKFTTYTVAGCIIWNTFLIYLGDYLGTNWEIIVNYLHIILVGLIAVFLIILVFILIRRRNHTLS
jgi:membrane protein DedA with SNARE-associated domain